MASVLYIIVAVLVLAVLIFVHELGHFLLAKWNNIAVIEFSIGFGKKIWQKRIGETRYSIGLIPLGGYVRMLGDDPFEEDPGFALQSVEDLPPELSSKLAGEKHRWFLSKGYFAKSAVVIAGPLFNLIFAWIIAVSLVYGYGVANPVDAPVIGDLVKDFPAEKSGLQKEDLVLEVNSVKILNWNQLAGEIAKSTGEIKLLVQRGTEQLNILVKPEAENEEMQLMSGRQNRQVIGIRQSLVENIPVSFIQALEYGTFHVYGMSYMSVKGIWYLIKGAISPNNIGGPVSIVREAARSADQGLSRVLQFMIFMSVSLAVLNLMPIPILDGGHLVFFVVELVLGSRRTWSIQRYANHVGMLLLLGLMFFALYNDLFHHLWKTS